MASQHTRLHQDAFVFEDLLHHVGLALGYRGDVGYLPAFLVKPEDLALEGFFAVDVSRLLHSCDKLVDTNRNWLLNCIIMMNLGQKAPLSCIFFMDKKQWVNG